MENTATPQQASTQEKPLQINPEEIITVATNLFNNNPDIDTVRLIEQVNDNLRNKFGGVLSPEQLSQIADTVFGMLEEKEGTDENTKISSLPKDISAEITNTLELEVQRNCVQSLLEKLLQNVPATGKLKHALFTGMLAAGFLYNPQEIAGKEQKAWTIAIEYLNIGEDILKNFKVELEVDQGMKGAYIVHIGQLHRDPDQAGLAGTIFKNTIIETQKEIEKLLLYLIEKQRIKAVFAEGIANKESLEEYKNFLQKLKNYLNEIQPNPTGVDRFISLYLQVAKITTNHPLIKPYIALMFKEKEKQLSEYIKSNPDDFNEKKFLRSIYESISALIRSSQQNEEEIYYFGADKKIYFSSKENEFELLPTENKKINKEAVKSLINAKERKVVYLSELAPSVGKAASSAVDSESLATLKNDLEQALEEERRNVYNRREDIAIEMIFADSHTRQILKDQSKKIIPLIYGAGHSFKRALLNNLNKKEESVKIGLLKLIPKVVPAKFYISK